MDGYQQYEIMHLDALFRNDSMTCDRCAISGSHIDEAYWSFDRIRLEYARRQVGGGDILKWRLRYPNDKLAFFYYETNVIGTSENSIEFQVYEEVRNKEELQSA